MIAVFRPMGGSNSQPMLVALCADSDAYERWLADDDYQVERVERKSVNTRGTHILYIVWHGMRVGMAYSQPDARRTVDHHRQTKIGYYIAQEIAVYE